MIAIVTHVTLFTAQQKDTENSFLMQNIEALTQAEQPDVNDCLYDPDTECWALHPTDPSKDIERRDSRW